MGYFPNGMSGACYQEQYCDRCIHEDPSGEGPFCPIWSLHLLHNYEECNKADSFLHSLIPLDADGFNTQCTMFVERLPELDQPPRSTAASIHSPEQLAEHIRRHGGGGA